MLTEQPITQVDPEQTTKKEGSNLPFRYERTYNKSEAQYTEWRIPPIRIKGKADVARTDEEIVEMIRRQHEGKRWNTSEYWRGKGLPKEQVELKIGREEITVYNWDTTQEFTDEHVDRLKKTLAEITRRFPDLRGKIRWILIDDIQQKTAFGDPEKYPLNGYAMPELRAFRLQPRGLGLFQHRVASATNFEGTVAHELTHLIQRQFEPDWSEHYRWEFCMDYPDEWEIRPTPDGTEKKWFNKATGEMAPQAQFPLQPDECINYYAKQNMGEDICDGMVAYLFDPELLSKISPKKHEVYAKYDRGLPLPETSSSRVASQDVALPLIENETILYYIEEPNQSGQQEDDFVIELL